MKNTINDLVVWVKDYVQGARATGVTIGMSGGKDSLIVAKLCCLALGEQNVFGVIIPNGAMKDLSDAIKTCELLNIKHTTVNIEGAYNQITEGTKNALLMQGKKINSISTINTPPRLRMALLYSIAASLNHLVPNTSNLSEASVGYSTKWGDAVGDFAPLLNFTMHEVCEMGIALGLPHELVYKTPDDGLSGMSDEQKLGFSYEELDAFIWTGAVGKNHQTILRMHNISAHKRQPIARFENNLENYFNKR